MTHSDLYTAQLVIFGPGYCGKAIAAHATKRGAKVTLIGRDTSPIDAQRALSWATHILSTVAPQGGDDPVLARYSDQIIPSQLRWLGYLSTTGVYGDTAGQIAREDAPTQSNVVRSKHRIKAEQAWQDLCGDDGAVHIFRLAGIYGPGRNALARVKAGTAQRVIKPDHVVSRIHIDDIVRIVTASMVSSDFETTIYNLCDDETVSPQQVIEYAARLLDMPPPPSISVAESGLSPMAASFYEETRRVCNEKVRGRFGQLSYPSYRDGLQALLSTV